MARGWLRAISGAELRPPVEIVGFVDIDAVAEWLGAEASAATAFASSDLEAVLAQTRPDLVFDIVVPGARANVVTTGLRHGCHVPSQKPMAGMTRSTATRSK